LVGLGLGLGLGVGWLDGGLGWRAGVGGWCDVGLGDVGLGLGLGLGDVGLGGAWGWGATCTFRGGVAVAQHPASPPLPPRGWRKGREEGRKGG